MPLYNAIPISTAHCRAAKALTSLHRLRRLASAFAAHTHKVRFRKRHKPNLYSMFIAALWSSAGKGLTYWLLFVMFNCNFVTFPCGILGQLCYLIVSIPGLSRLSYFKRGIFA